MFVSVVIPAYNEEHYLPACLEALQQQTYPSESFEMIVVDNASTDETATIAQRFGARVVYEPVKGIARARQRGFEVARGEIIASTDADTVVPPSWLSHIVAHFSRNRDVVAVYGPVYWPTARPHERWIMRYPVTWALVVSNQVGRTLWVGSNFAVRADAFWKVGGFTAFDPQGLLGEDVYLSLRVSRVGQALFDPDLAVYASPRRVREGYWNFLRRTALSALRTTLLGEPSLPPPDIR